MDIILISHSGGQTLRLRFFPRSWKFLLPAVLVPLTLVIGGAWLGYRWAPETRGMSRIADAATVLDEQVAGQRREIANLRQRIDDNVHALAQRLGQLQAHVTRLNAVGERMALMAELETGEFDFNSPPPLGGPEAQETVGAAPTISEFRAALDRFENELQARERQMQVLRELMVAGELREEIVPSGHPVKGGWISSGFGQRTDPFSGRLTRHHGIDFAAGMGADVISVASGVVVYAGRRAGYGQLVEINHGNGYATRYAHNSEVTVKVGERVERGQLIAKMGSSGRSTGPHVHFEVLRNGRIVNPTAYIQASR